MQLNKRPMVSVVKRISLKTIKSWFQKKKDLWAFTFFTRRSLMENLMNSIIHGVIGCVEAMACITLMIIIINSCYVSLNLLSFKTQTVYRIFLCSSSRSIKRDFLMAEKWNDILC